MHRDRRVAGALLIMSILSGGIGFSACVQTPAEDAVAPPSRKGAVTSGSDTCVNDTWTETSLVGAPSHRAGHSAVWTGTEMIVWGGGGSGPFYNTGGRYDPTSDAWVPTSTNGAPDARAVHVAVWTGTEMIVWGGLANGSTYLATGGRYNPVTNTWLPTSLKNAPDARVQHTAVWTGTEMIVWGGRAYYTYMNTGARYNPDSDTWTPTNVDGAPTPRTQHTAIWTGTEMIVWGGGYEFPLNAGGGYDPAAENTGGRYDPATDTWVATGTDGAPHLGRRRKPRPSLFRRPLRPSYGLLDDHEPIRPPEPQSSVVG